MNDGASAKPCLKRRWLLTTDFIICAAKPCGIIAEYYIIVAGTASTARNALRPRALGLPTRLVLTPPSRRALTWCINNWCRYHVHGRKTRQTVVERGTQESIFGIVAFMKTPAGSAQGTDHHVFEAAEGA